MNVLQILVICVILIAVILVLFLPLPRSQGNASTPVERPHTGTVFRDDDRYWYRGLFYNNPDDPAMFVPKRYGLGWTFNFGHSRARLFVITLLVVVLLLLVVPPLAVAFLGGGSLHSSGCHLFSC